MRCARTFAAGPACAVQLAMALALLLPGSAVPRPADGEVVEAIWRVQNLRFEYNSVHYHYACDAFEKKIGAILQAVGAHQSSIVRTGCGSSLQNTIQASIVVATPVPANEENIRAATTFDTHDELVARLRKMALPARIDLVKFPAGWRTLSLTETRDLNLEAGDCDLLRELMRQVFPKLDVHTLKKPYCMSTATRIRPKLEVQALVPTEPASAHL